MMDQTALDEVFPNNPLREVAFEIRFPLNLRILPNIYRAQEELGLEYSEIAREEVQSPGLPTSTNYNFVSPTLGRTIRVFEDRFVVVFTKYKTFEEFLSEVIKRTKRFCEAFHVRQSTRVGLRYVNNISIPIANTIPLLFKYVRPYLDKELLDSGRIKQFAIEALMQKDDCSLTVRSAFLAQAALPEAGIYVLDLDTYLAGGRDLENLRVLLEKFHYHIQVEFLSHLTDDYKDLMRRQE